jgi:hypothetical protein
MCLCFVLVAATFLAALSCTVNAQGVRPLAMQLRLCCGAAAGRAQVNGMQLADKIVYVGPFLKRTDRSPTDSKYTNVYVKNLSEDVDDEALEKLAAEYGEVVSAIIMKVGALLPSSGATVYHKPVEGLSACAVPCFAYSTSLAAYKLK